MKDWRRCLLIYSFRPFPVRAINPVKVLRVCRYGFSFVFVSQHFSPVNLFGWMDVKTLGIVSMYKEQLGLTSAKFTEADHFHSFINLLLLKVDPYCICFFVFFLVFKKIRI